MACNVAGPAGSSFQNIISGKGAIMHDLVAYKAATSEEQEAIPLPRILIIDDSPAICDLLCQVLEHACYRVAAVPGGESAWPWIDQAMHSGDPPALILLDLSLPSRNGIILHHLRAQRDTFLPPVIVMTTSKHIYEEVAPVERVICKPFHLCDLLAEVERVIPLAPQREHGYPANTVSL